jgi:hypothetical protein
MLAAAAHLFAVKGNDAGEHIPLGTIQAGDGLRQDEITAYQVALGRILGQAEVVQSGR